MIVDGCTCKACHIPEWLFLGCMIRRPSNFLLMSSHFVPFSSHLLAVGGSGGKSKGKSKASKARDLEMFGLDSLLSEATVRNKTSAGIALRMIAVDCLNS